MISKRLPFLYYLASTLSLLAIGWAARHFGETNLPPLLPLIRYLILALYANWILSYVLLAMNASSLKAKSWFWFALAGSAVCVLHPVFSGDLMEYLIRGRMLVVHGVSPYVGIPLDFPNDPLRPYSVWINNPDSYGPLSVYLQTIPVLIFRDSIFGMTWSYKMMALGFFGLAAFFFARIVKAAGSEEAGRDWTLFAYSPLLVVTACVDGHNDMIMMAFSVAALSFFLEGRYGRSFFTWTLGFLVKYMNAIEMPFMALQAVKAEWKKKSAFPWLFVLRNFLMFTGLAVLLFVPVWGGEGTFLAIWRQNTSFYTNTFPYLIYKALEFLKLPVGTQAVKTACLSAYMIFYFYLLVKTWKLESPKSVDFFRFVSLAYLGFYLALPSPMGYWYLVWALPWIVLARWPRPVAAAVIFSALGMLAFYKRINFLSVIAMAGYAFLVLTRLRACVKIPRL